MTTRLNWGILGTGAIANKFAQGISQTKTGSILAVGSRNQATADIFGERWRIPNRYNSYEEVLADPEVQVVYISTPHPFHREWAIKAAEAGKHILCEKPIALNYNDTLSIIEAARHNDVFFLEGFMYRLHPQIERLITVIQSGVIGQVRLIQASFSFDGQFSPQSRILSNELGGGGILDVGGYTTSMARLIAGVAIGKAFAEPLALAAVGHVGATAVDEYTIASVLFPGNILAQLMCGVQLEVDSVVRIFGSQGSIEMLQPWVPMIDQNTRFIVRSQIHEPEELVIEYEHEDLYKLEADTVASFLGQRQSPAMSWEDTLGNMKMLDSWRRALGVMYHGEQVASNLDA